MESRTYLKNIRITPKKLRLMLRAVKKLPPAEALQALQKNNDKTSKIFYKAIKSAVTNARHTLKVSDNLLQWRTLAVDEGMKLRRHRPGARGMVRPFYKKYSHINIVLESSEVTISKS